MPEYIISGMKNPASTDYFSMRLDTFSGPFTEEDAFNLRDYLISEGHFVEPGSEVNARPYWTNNIPDPRP